MSMPKVHALCHGDCIAFCTGRLKAIAIAIDGKFRCSLRPRSGNCRYSELNLARPIEVKAKPQREHELLYLEMAQEHES